MRAYQNCEATLGALAVGVALGACGTDETKVDPCATAQAYDVGATVHASLDRADCLTVGGIGSIVGGKTGSDDSVHVDYYRFNVTGTASLGFTLTSSAFDTYLLLTDAAGNLLAENDDDGTGGTNSTFRLLLGPGTYQAGVNSYLSAGTGPYTLTSAAVAAEVTNCEGVFATTGITTAQTISATDCGPAPFGDNYWILLRSGESITVTETSADFNATLWLYSYATASWVGYDDDGGGGTDALMSFTAPAGTPGYFAILVQPKTDQTGAYTLTIQ